MQEAVKRGAKFIELRLDFLAKAVDFKRLAPLKQCPWVATLRRPADGGRFTGTEHERMMILRQAIVSGAFEWVDLETDIAGTIPRFGQVKRIVSYHNTAETPGNLEDIYAKMLQQDARRVQARGDGPDRRRRRARPATPAERARSRPSRSAWATSASRAASWR